MTQILKYPRTRHIEGSKEQFGDSELEAVPFSELQDKHLVVEEKMDGSNSGISFSEDGELLLQSRGHFLTGGPRERHFAVFKTWTNMFQGLLFELLGSRYIMYGEWMFAKHAIFYDDLPHYFLEFDIFDRQKNRFQSTRNRKAMLKNYPFIHSVRVLREGRFQNLEDLTGLIGPSYAITTANRQHLESAVIQNNLDLDRAVRETDLSGTMEGLYIK